MLEIRHAKIAALQEASFYRAKLAAYESGSPVDASKLDKERIEELEQKLSDAVTAKSSADRQLAQVSSDLEQEQTARAAAEERNTTALARAETAEASHTRMLAEHTELHTRSIGLDNSLQDHIEKIMTLQSTHAQLQADHDHAQSRVAASEAFRDQYTKSLEQLQLTLQAANARADEMHSLWTQTKGDLDEQKATNARLIQDLETQTSEAFAASTKAEELDRILKTTREENEAMRALTSGSIADLVASTRETRTADVGSDDLRSSKARAVEEEANGLRTLHQQSVSRLEASATELADLKSRNVDLERHLIATRSEVEALRTRHAAAVKDYSLIKGQIAARDQDLREKARLAEAAEVKAGLLRSLMAENGMAMDDDFANRSLESIMSTTESPEQLARRIHDLEARLERRGRSHTELQTAHDETQRELHITEDKYREASRKHEAAADEISALVQEVQRLRSGGATSTTPLSTEGNGGAGDEELAALQERHRTLEQTHLKAVQYVKGTEKMLRRMKEELSKYKERTEQLEGELASRGPTSPTAVASSGGNRDQVEALQAQIEQLRTNADKSKVENEELQQHIVALQSDYAEKIGQQQDDADARHRAAEAEVRRLEEAHLQTRKDLEEAQQLNTSLNDLMLQQGNAHASGSAEGAEGRKQLETSLIQAQKQAEWLKMENAELEARCKDAENKVRPLQS